MVKIQHFKHRMKFNLHQNMMNKKQRQKNTVNLNKLKAGTINL